MSSFRSRLSQEVKSSVLCCRRLGPGSTLDWSRMPFSIATAGTSIRWLILVILVILVTLGVPGVDPVLLELNVAVLIYIAHLKHSLYPYSRIHFKISLALWEQQSLPSKRTCPLSALM